MVLIMTEWHSTQQAFTQAGYSHRNLHPSQATSGSGTLALQQLRRGDYMLLWIDLPSRRTLDTHAAAMTRRWIFIRKLIDTAIFTNTPAIIYGTCGSAWRADVLKALEFEGIAKAATHHWCRFGIRFHDPGNMQPSARKSRTLSTIVVPPHPCRCAHTVEHYRDVAEDGLREQGQARNKAEALVVSRLLGSLGSRISSPLRVPESNQSDTIQSNQLNQNQSNLAHDSNSSVEAHVGVAVPPVPLTNQAVHHREPGGVRARGGDDDDNSSTCSSNASERRRGWQQTQRRRRRHDNDDTATVQGRVRESPVPDRVCESPDPNMIVHLMRMLVSNPAPTTTTTTRQASLNQVTMRMRRLACPVRYLLRPRIARRLRHKAGTMPVSLVLSSRPRFE